MIMDTIFISYSHKDEKWKDQVQSHLNVLEKHGKLNIWDDRQIPLGGDWLEEIERSLEQANIALLLISRHFLTSDFILNKEIPELLQRQEQSGLKVIPIILSPCSWQSVDWLAATQGYPKDNKPLSGMTEHQRDESLAMFANRLLENTENKAGARWRNTKIKPELSNFKPQTVKKDEATMQPRPKQTNWLIIAAFTLVIIGIITLAFNWIYKPLPKELEVTEKASPATTNITITSDGNSQPTVATGNATVTINHSQIPPIETDKGTKE